MKKLSSLTPCLKNTIITFIIVLLITFIFYIFKFEGNITGFFCIGSVLPLSPYLNPETTKIVPDEIGYDGQLFLTIALDPLLKNPDSILALDNPPFRYRRILYPFLSYLISLGNRNLIPYVMVGLNVIAISLIVLLVSLYLKHYKQKTESSLCILSIPGIWIVLAFSTADVINSLWMIAAIYFYTIKSPKKLSVAIILACLTRETSLLIWLTFVILSIWEKHKNYLLYLIPAIFPAIFWNIYVLLRFNQQNIAGVESNFVYPFQGILEKFTLIIQTGLQGKNIYDLYCFLLLITIILFNIIVSYLKIDSNRIIFIQTLFTGIVVVMSSQAILSYFFNYPRTFIDVYILLFLLQGGRMIKSIQYGTAGLLGVSSLMFLVAHT
jgi:hypothetical protein